MPTEKDTLSPQERLAISRNALVNQLTGNRQRVEQRITADGQTVNVKPSFSERFAWAGIARKVGQRWWRRHPANAVGLMARPALERYGRHEPYKLVAIAAATGAVIGLLRPWRLLSAGAVMAAVFKSSDIADMIATIAQRQYPQTYRNDEH